MEKSTKAELLAHYAMREPHEFKQWDGFDLSKCGPDDVMHADENGVCVMSSKTFELMSGCCEVRVLVRPDVSPEWAALCLRRMAGDLEASERLKVADKLEARIKANGTANLKRPGPDLSNVGAWFSGSPNPVLAAAGDMILPSIKNAAESNIDPDSEEIPF